VHARDPVTRTGGRTSRIARRSGTRNAALTLPEQRHCAALEDAYSLATGRRFEVIGA
jgi:hypothetical protein